MAPNDWSNGAHFARRFTLQFAQQKRTCNPRHNLQITCTTNHTHEATLSLRPPPKNRYRCVRRAFAFCQNVRAAEALFNVCSHQKKKHIIGYYRVRAHMSRPSIECILYIVVASRHKRIKRIDANFWSSRGRFGASLAGIACAGLWLHTVVSLNLSIYAPYIYMYELEWIY